MSLQSLLIGCQLIASAQATLGSAVDDPETLAKLAQASVDQGVHLLRLQGIENIRAIRAATQKACIGLIKRTYPPSDVIITASSAEVNELLATDCEIIALDGTERPRPNGENLRDLIQQIHAAGRLAMADCDSIESARYSIAAGADIVGTTLAGYTPNRQLTVGPDLELLRQIVAESTVPVIAEGRYASRWEVESALRIGATAVVVGGALNDPVKTTLALLPTKPPTAPIGAVDIGGTWLRFALFTPDWKLIEVVREPNPPTRDARLAWIQAQIQRTGVQQVGVSSGGIFDPRTGICITAKEYLMHDHIGIEFSERTLKVKTFTHGDGHATAWGHACLPRYAGRRVATLAIGTGLGCGFVQKGEIWAGHQGEYPRINDQPTRHGRTYEELLGGIHITKTPSEEKKADAVLALEGAIQTLRDLYFPDDIVIAGSVGLSDWLADDLVRLGVDPSPFGTDAGLYGAAALALFPQVP